MDTKECVKRMKALGDETRLQIFEMLRGGELCACKILERLHITQPTLSHHMRILCDSGLVIAKKDWKWTHYSVDRNALHELSSYFGDWNDAADMKKE